MAEKQQLLQGVSLNYTPTQVNTFLNYVFWIIVAVLALVLIIFFVWKLWQKLQYRMSVNLHREVGSNVIVEEQRVRKVYTADGKYAYHYIPINKKSPVFHDSYNKLIKRPAWFGLSQKVTIGFDAYLKDGKIIPMKYNKAYDENGEEYAVALSGVDYDMTNFLKMELDDYYEKKKRTNALMQMMPYIALMVVIVTFILGTILNNQHTEKMVEQMITFGKTSVNSIVAKIGEIQVLKGV